MDYNKTSYLLLEKYEPLDVFLQELPKKLRAPASQTIPGPSPTPTPTPTEVKTPRNGLYAIKSAPGGRSGGKALCTLHNSNDSANKGNQEPVILYDYYGDATQNWILEKVQ